jgi:hypothetical protein
MDEVAEPPIERIGREEYERRLAGLGSLFPLSPAAYDSYVLSKDENS